jgi:Ti-type conjugative transfer relaxase TraA
MAIYHAHIQVIGRSGGRSVVAAAAYRAADVLHDKAHGHTHDYTAKTGVVHSEIMLPSEAPARWEQGTTEAELHTARSTLWNEVEAKERRHDAQLAREMEFAIPRELPRAETVRLARDFVREQFVDRGMVADLNVHWGMGKDGEAKPHAHVMLTMRQVTPEGFGPKVREWNAAGLYDGVRQRWAELANERLAELGHDVRIDHRSNSELEIALVPQNKIGPAGARRAERNEEAERAAEHLAIARRNGEAILADPGVVLDAITRQHSTFSRRDLARFVNRHTADGEQFGLAMAKVEASAELVRVGVDGRGEARFSTRELLAAERRMEAAALALSGSRTHPVREDRRRAARTGSGLGSEQAAALGHVTRSRDLVAVVGYAGTGKSTMLGVARQAWEAQGYRVVGAALSGIAAEGLEAGSRIGSRTLASLEYGWREGRDLLGSRDVLVVDEAGMVGSRQMERVLSAVQAAGAKVVLVGDPEQLQAIEAGAAFRAIVERVGSVEITQVVRQREAWQREATKELATGRTAEALGRYAAAGMVRASETRVEAMAALVAGWDEGRLARPGESQVLLASTRADVAALNGLARERLRASGELGADQVVATERGERSLAAGDRVMLGRNERGLGAGPGGRGGVAVKNGTLGTVLGVEAGGGRLTVRVDGQGGPGSQGGQVGKEVTFSLGEYGHVDHGYAATVHKAQGVTADRAHVLASRFMDRHAAYVGLTRHRAGVVLHYAREEFADSAALAESLGRERAKDTSLDYASGAGSEDLVAAYAARRGLGPERETVLRQAAAREAAERRVAEQRQAIEAGRAGFRERYEAHQRERLAAAEREAQAHGLVQAWDQVMGAYSAALPSLERDATLGGTRERLLEVGQAVREQPGAVQVLRERGAEFGLGERPGLAQVVSSARPDRAVGEMMQVAEAGMRAQLREQAALEAVRQQEAARRRELDREQSLRARPRERQGPGMSM